MMNMDKLLLMIVRITLIALQRGNLSDDQILLTTTQNSQ